MGTLTKSLKDEVGRLEAERAELVAALREVAEQRTTHLRSNQMQNALNERKEKARALLAKLGAE